MTSSESFDHEIRRLQYLEAMGIDSYIPRHVLPGALPSVVFDWPESSASPLPDNVSTTAIADKNALLRLQQDLGVLPRKVPVATRDANVPALSVAPAKASATTGVMQFQLAIFQPTRELLVLVPAQHTDAVYLQLLKNILLAKAVKPDALVPVDNFIWPPRVAGMTKVNHSPEAAQETLHALLEGHQLKNGIKHILVFAGILAEKLFSVEATADQALARLNILSLPDLQQMLEDGAYKKITWQKIRSLAL